MKSISEKIGYGFGDMSSSMFWKIFSYYLPIFYSDVFGLKPQHAAILLLVTKLYDAISDPFMGIIADRTQSRFGRYRPYLLWMALPFGIIGLASFYTPDAGYTFKHVYAYITYLLMMTVYTAINVPYGAMLGVVSSDAREKSIFSSYRMFFAYIGSFIAMAIFMAFEKRVGGSVSNATPAQWTVAVGIIAAICVLLFVACFALTREHVTTPAASRKPIGSDLKALAGNGPWWFLLFSSVGLLICGALRGGAAAYYFANIFKTSVWITCAAYLFIGEIAQMVGVLIAVPIADRIGKKSTFIVSLFAIAVLCAAVWYVPPFNNNTSATLLVVLQVLTCIFIGIVSPLLWAMFADVADYSEAVNGTQSTGLIFSSSSMAQKFGGALGAFILLQILATEGYDATLPCQPVAVHQAIRGLMSWMPAACALLAAISLFFYPLTENKMRDIRKELNR